MTAPATTTDEPPVYKADEVPEGLRTMTQLKADRLKPTEGQQPVGYLRKYRRGHGWGQFPLYHPAEAAPMKPLSEKQQAAKDQRRTCPRCGVVGKHIVYDGACRTCREADEQASRELQARTCVWCRRVSLAAHAEERHGACEPCWIRRAITRQLEAERRAVWARTCPHRDCSKVTATDEEIAAVRAAGDHWVPRWCPPCREADELKRAERQRAYEELRARAAEARRRQVADLEAWARAALADPDVTVLDTETTGLDDEARIVDLGVTTTAGDALLDTLVDPGQPIPVDATDVHGVTDAMVQGAPTFGAVLDMLTAVLAGKRCLIYNAPYDRGRLRHELAEHYRHAGHADPAAAAQAWLDTVRFEDVMERYSDWYGEEDFDHGGYRWQPLYGGDHRAVSDCRAVGDRLRDMARGMDE